MHIMLISDQEVYHASWQLYTKAQSYDFGRRLYQIKAEQSLYWLKFQIAGQNLHIQAAFEHELSCYTALQNTDLLLPHRLMALQTTPEAEYSTGQGLLLPHATAFLEKPCHNYTVPEILDMILQLLTCLATWQRLGWIHGDIKPEHWVRYEGRCYLFDLEQSRRVDGAACLVLCSTPRYMAPELFQGAQKSQQSDLYATGIVLWQWLMPQAQRLSSQSYRDWAIWHCQQPFARLPTLYQCFQALLDGMLAKRGVYRFSSAQEALELLQHQRLQL